MLWPIQKSGSSAPKWNREHEETASPWAPILSNMSRCCFTADILSMNNCPVSYALLYSLHRWRNENSEQLIHMPKTDGQRKARSSDSLKGSFYSTGYFKKCTSWPLSSLLLTISMILYPEEGWKSRPACTGDGAIHYTHGEKSSCFRRTSQKPVPNLSCFRFWLALPENSWQSLAEECLWRPPDYEVLFKEAEEEKGSPSTSLF